MRKLTEEQRLRNIEKTKINYRKHKEEGIKNKKKIRDAIEYIDSHLFISKKRLLTILKGE